MKRVLILSVLFAFFLGNTTSNAQDRIENLPNKDKGTWNFGYYLGIMKTSYRIDYKKSLYPEAKVVVDGGYGYKIGVIGELRFNKNVSLRLEPGLATNVKTLYFNNKTLATERDSVRKVPTTYLHLPLMLKLSTDRLNNIRPFVIGGVSYDYNFSANEENPDDNLAGEFRLKRHNFMYEVGIGMDFYLSYFKFSPSIVGVFSINNELVPDNNDATSPYTGPIESLGTRGVFLKLVFD
jgi:hypothetical protein